MPIAPRTCFAHITRPPSKRALWDTTVTELLAGSYEPDERGHRPPECLYGATKMWAHLRRQGLLSPNHSPLGIRYGPPAPSPST